MCICISTRNFVNLPLFHIMKPELTFLFCLSQVALKDCSSLDKELLNEVPKLSQGDNSSIGPIDQSAFKDFSFINPKWCRAQ